MARYRLTADGQYFWEGSDALAVVDHMWDEIKLRWDRGWVLEDTQPAPDQHCSTWCVCWRGEYNGVELTPMVL